MRIELTLEEAKYLALKALGIAATLKSRGGYQVLQADAEVIISGTVESSTRVGEEDAGVSNQEGLSV